MNRLLVFCLFLLAAACGAQTNDTAARLKGLEESLSHLDARLTRQMNELLLYQRLGDVALVDKVSFTAASRHQQPRATPREQRGRRVRLHVPAPGAQTFAAAPAHRAGPRRDSRQRSHR